MPDFFIKTKICPMKIWKFFHKLKNLQKNFEKLIKFKKSFQKLTNFQEKFPKAQKLSKKVFQSSGIFKNILCSTKFSRKRKLSTFLQNTPKNTLILSKDSRIEKVSLQMFWKLENWWKICLIFRSFSKVDYQTSFKLNSKNSCLFN